MYSKNFDIIIIGNKNNSNLVLDSSNTQIIENILKNQNNKFSLKDILLEGGDGFIVIANGKLSKPATDVYVKFYESYQNIVKEESLKKFNKPIYLNYNLKEKSDEIKIVAIYPTKQHLNYYFQNGFKHLRLAYVNIRNIYNPSDKSDPSNSYSDTNEFTNAYRQWLFKFIASYQRYITDKNNKEQTINNYYIAKKPPFYRNLNNTYKTLEEINLTLDTFSELDRNTLITSLLRDGISENNIEKTFNSYDYLQYWNLANDNTETPEIIDNLITEFPYHLISSEEKDNIISLYSKYK